jgi:nitrous oxide reductase accessory protein NosL
MLPCRVQYCNLLITIICLVAIQTLNPAEFSLAARAGKGPAPGLTPLDQNGQMQIGPQDRCPVCGMKVAKYNKFNSAIQLSDLTTFYFCSSGCMLRAWLHPDIFLASSKGELKSTVVREYFTGAQVDGKAVSWVVGSDVVGPMGPAFVPVKGKQALEIFKRRHGGKVIFMLKELDPEKWLTITGRRAAK